MSAIIRLIIVIYLLPLNVFSQTWQWERSIPGSATTDNGYAICTDGSGNCYVASVQGSQGFVSKYNSSGFLLWSTGMIDQIYYGVSVCYDADHLYYAGDSLGNIVVIKFDTAGNLNWKTACGTGQAKAIAADHTGHLYLTGHQTFLVQLDTSGSVIWTQSIPNPRGNSVSTDLAGYVYVTGEFGGTLAFGSDTLTAIGSCDIFVAKYDSSGNCVWGKRSGGDHNTNPLSGDRGYGICSDNSSNIYVTGSFADTADFGSTTLTNIFPGTSDVFLAKYDANGNLIWAKAATGVSDQEGRCVAIDYQGNILIAGSYVPQLYFSSYQLNGWGNYDAFVAKFDPNGNFISVIAAGGPVWNEFVYGICADISGNIFAAGTYCYTSYFGTDSLTNSGNYDAFVAKIDFATGMEDINSISVLSTFPNPANDRIVFQLKNSVVEIIITDQLGREIRRQKLNGEDQIEISVTDLADGMYFYQLVEKERLYSAGKFVVRH